MRLCAWCVFARFPAARMAGKRRSRRECRQCVTEAVPQGSRQTHVVVTPPPALRYQLSIKGHFARHLETKQIICAAVFAWPDCPGSYLNSRLPPPSTKQVQSTTQQLGQICTEGVGEAKRRLEENRPGIDQFVKNIGDNMQQGVKKVQEVRPPTPLSRVYLYTYLRRRRSPSCTCIQCLHFLLEVARSPS